MLQDIVFNGQAYSLLHVPGVNAKHFLWISVMF